MLELVVAHYQEDLSWLRKRPADLRVTVYDKRPDTSGGPDAVLLPNVGREAHTYLHHIMSRYDSLADWTIFCQGKPFDHAYDFKKTLRVFAENTPPPAPPLISRGGASNLMAETLPIKKDPLSQVVEPLSLFQGEGWDGRPLPWGLGFHWLGHLIDTDDAEGNRLFRPWSKNDDGRGLDLRGFHRALFGTDGPDYYTFVLGAQFAIHRDVVCRQPVSFYERALDVSMTFPDAAHCFERSWDRVFGVIGIDPVWLAGRLTVLLKPMRYQSES